MERRIAAKRWMPPAEFYSSELCNRCGICCGSTDGHPCEHLRPDGAGIYRCAVYEERLGPHRTVDGLPFVCVRIQMIIEIEGGYADCGYVREIRRIREQLGQDTSDLGRMKHP
jgi:hypothetical protein